MKKIVKKTVKNVTPAIPAKTIKAEKVKTGWGTFENFDRNIFRVGGMAKPSQPFEKASEAKEAFKEGAILYGGIVRPAKIGKSVIVTQDYKPLYNDAGEDVQTKMETFTMNRNLVEKLGGKIIFAEDLKKPTHLIDTKAGELQGFSLGEKGKWSAYALILKSGKILFSQKESGGSKFPNAKRIAENSFVKGIVKQLA